MRKIPVACKYAAVTALVYALDQGLKAAVRRLPLAEPVFMIPGIAEVVRCENTGAAFSLLSGQTALIIALSVVLLAWLFIHLLRDLQMTASAHTALAVLLGGALGNLTDRLLFGAVTDYIRLLLIDFPVFNFADICITLSIAVLAYELLSGRLDKQPGEKEHGSAH